MQHVPIVLRVHDERRHFDHVVLWVAVQFSKGQQHLGETLHVAFQNPDLKILTCCMRCMQMMIKIARVLTFPNFN